MNTEKKTISYNKKTGVFTATIEFPREFTGQYTYSLEEKWVMPFVSLVINENNSSYTLNSNFFLDYKDSLQASDNVLYSFDQKDEAMAFAKEHGLRIQYL